MTENDIRSEKSKNAFRFRGEVFGNYSEALQTIHELTQAGRAVVGVELFERMGKTPKWIATSNYDHSKEHQWSEYCLLCRKSAEEFVKKNKGQKNGIFTLMSIDETEFTK